MTVAKGSELGAAGATHTLRAQHKSAVRSCKALRASARGSAQGQRALEADRPLIGAGLQKLTAAGGVHHHRLGVERLRRRALGRVGRAFGACFRPPSLFVALSIAAGVTLVGLSLFSADRCFASRGGPGVSPNTRDAIRAGKCPTISLAVGPARGEAGAREAHREPGRNARDGKVFARGHKKPGGYLISPCVRGLVDFHSEVDVWRGQKCQRLL